MSPRVSVVAMGALVGKQGFAEVGLVDGPRLRIAVPFPITRGVLAGRYGFVGASLTIPAGVEITLRLDSLDALNWAMSALAGAATPRSPMRTKAKRLAKNV